MTGLSFSQSGYPKKIVLQTDTVIAITVKQMDRVNEIYLQNKECQESKTTMSNELNYCEQQIESIMTETVILESQKEGLRGQIEVLLDKNELSEQEKKELEKNIKKQKISLIVHKVLICLSILGIIIL